MGHEIRYADYPEKVNKRQVQDEWDSYVRHTECGYQEGASGLPQPIRWLERLFDTRDEAKAWIEKNEREWYDCLAVKYKEEKPSKTIDELRTRVQELRAKYAAINSKPHFEGAKSEYVGCKTCGSKLNVKYVKNHCPLCSADLRPSSTLAAIARAEAAWEAAEKKLNAERKKSTSNNVRWLVKVEYHC